ncbi:MULTISPECIES: helix-turn-helix transcriptional regulator [unclassified Amycolatopsis]|uniref:helix-turn-helix domain-containing protein n=1 Tax=unclassified Amycolatopsis TaxID=2618356 RepID=UPI00106ED258|nr:MULTISPECIES: helix-turn-helix transcriptional regulator [unclassified Amycolatopsis]
MTTYTIPDPPALTHFARTVRDARAQSGLSADEFGRRLGFSGVTVIRWERGQRRPPMPVRSRVLRQLGAPLEGSR